MLYVIIILAVVVAALMVLRLRIRFELTEGKRSLFIGLGRSGALIDFVRKQKRLTLFGVTVKSLVSKGERQKDSEKDKEAV